MRWAYSYCAILPVASARGAIACSCSAMSRSPVIRSWMLPMLLLLVSGAIKEFCANLCLFVLTLPTVRYSDRQRSGACSREHLRAARSGVRPNKHIHLCSLHSRMHFELTLTRRCSLLKVGSTEWLNNDRTDREIGPNKWLLSSSSNTQTIVIRVCEF